MLLRGRTLRYSRRQTSVRPMSENTVNAALRRLRYMSRGNDGSWVRSAASTSHTELGWPRDEIGRPLSHGERDEV